MNTRTQTNLDEPQPHLGNLISDYQAGLTDQGQTRQVEEHLAGCEQCRQFYQRLEESRYQIANLPDRSPISIEAEDASYYRVMQRTVYPANRKRAKRILKEETKKGGKHD